MTTILKNGNYFRYGKKTIPNQPIEGNSDFSTAEVRLKGFKTSPDTSSLICIIPPSDWEMDGITAMQLATGTDDETYTVPLYKDGLYVPLGTSPTVSGDAEIDDGLLLIYGDCTITAE